MTAPSAKPAHRPIRDLEIPLTPLKAHAVRDGDSKIPDASLVARIRSEFLEMRGFSPTLQQAGRLFHLAQDECRQVLAALVNEGFLHEERDGRYRLSRHR
jgi:hypothetical protein